MSGRGRLSESVTLWLNPAYGYATLAGSLPKHFRGSNVETVTIAEVGPLCDELVTQCEEAGWFKAEGEPPYGGRFKRLDVAFDLGCDDRSDVLERARWGLRLARNEKPVIYGRPAESLAVLRSTRARRSRIDHRAYDKGVEVGDPDLDQMRLEMPLSAYRLDKVGCRSFDRDLGPALEAAWDALDQRGWWALLDGPGSD